ncbi:hypothetical protein TTHERM_00312580 (macronuclear) [Tetrahymena thermophila SB210]|uniref:Uncharacterized protein n=1 Tax=Tetrahymena thermophila (strain SB210) TaxID=312017 RepID=Q22KM3_TETTS|nr:hypothetical protein TTHERM_00312580 [Tetrahymena thermophila SB210]EAR85776.1 hypothetical protein TTHERM_00312580 [Tetrahymena thermophila SB210]|eukprot:XP_001033439.1 hypothetical protein TTHERM_00312580 [Tetrahymena thermophila SB210]
MKSQKFQSKITLTDLQKETRVLYLDEEKNMDLKWNQIWFSDQSHIVTKTTKYKYFWSTQEEKSENQSQIFNEKALILQDSQHLAQQV